MPKRTQHGHLRHSQNDRPTKEAFRDRNDPQEIYRDQNTQNWVFVGPQGRTHIFLPDGRHHTSFRTTKRARQRRVHLGRWIQVDVSQFDKRET